MNKPRRKQLEAITAKLDELKGEIEALKEEEEEYRDNMPENLRGSEKYEKADEVCYALESAVDTLDEVIDNINGAIE